MIDLVVICACLTVGVACIVFATWPVWCAAGRAWDRWTPVVDDELPRASLRRR